MGLVDKVRNVVALEQAGGDIIAAVEFLFNLDF